jgi:hypothetical protein
MILGENAANSAVDALESVEALDGRHSSWPGR